jgi:uncharacterized lipoprotein YmbA
MRSTTVLAWAALALDAACGITARESFYVLEGPPTPPPATAAPTMSVFVGPVMVPEAVDRTPMVIRTSPNQVEVEDFHRWAEPLKSAIPRVVADDLVRELGTARVGFTRAASLAPVDYRVAIEIQRFDSSLTDGATLDASWTITATQGGTPRTGRTVAQEPVQQPTHAAVAAAHSRALAPLATVLLEVDPLDARAMGDERGRARAVDAQLRDLHAVRRGVPPVHVAADRDLDLLLDRPRGDRSAGAVGHIGVGQVDDGPLRAQGHDAHDHHLRPRHGRLPASPHDATIRDRDRVPQTSVTLRNVRIRPP